MPHPSKRKGNAYERELINHFKQKPGWYAERAFASNGRALGEVEECDLIIESPLGHRFTVQAKRRKALPAYLLPPDDVKLVMARADRGETLVVMSLSMFEDLVR